MLDRTSKILQPPHAFAGLSRRSYRTITMDPPTHFESRTALKVANWNCRRDVEKHYATLSFDELAALPLSDLRTRRMLTCLDQRPAPAARLRADRTVGLSLFDPRVHVGQAAAPAYRSGVTEADLHVGLGLTVRHQNEIVLLGRRGNARRNAKDVREVILTPVREHSRKPDEFFARIERYCDGPYLELFARERRPGWDAGGTKSTSSARGGVM